MLWQPTQDAQTLQVLSVLKIFCLIFTASLSVVHEIFVVANKLKAQAIATLISGIANIVIVYILLKTTDLGIFAIAGVSSIIAIIRNFMFTFPYAAKCVKQKWYVFYGLSLRAFASYAIITSLFYAVRVYIYTPNAWWSFIIECGICGLIGLVLNALFISSKSEIKALFSKITKIKNKIIKKKTEQGVSNEES